MSFDIYPGYFPTLGHTGAEPLLILDREGRLIPHGILPTAFLSLTIRFLTVWVKVKSVSVIKFPQLQGCNPLQLFSSTEPSLPFCSRGFALKTDEFFSAKQTRTYSAVLF